jgi:hypothetical protein
VAILLLPQEHDVDKYIFRSLPRHTTATESAQEAEGRQKPTGSALMINESLGGLGGQPLAVFASFAWLAVWRQ